MASATASIAAEAIAAVFGEFELEETLDRRLAAGYEPALVYVARIRTLDLSALADVDLDETVAENAIASVGEPGSFLPDATAIHLSDGDWCGRPDDDGYAHLEPDPRLLDPGEVEVRVPYGAEAAQRSELRVATVEAANADGWFDAFSARSTVADGSVEVRAVAAHGYGRDGFTVYRGTARHLVPGPEKAVVSLAPTADRLDVPAAAARYGGTGGPDGTSEMNGLAVPQTFGECFGVPGFFEDPGNLIGRVHDGPVLDLTLYEAGVPRIVWDGRDLPNYAALLQSPPEPGFWTKCTAEGRYALGDSPVGPITLDVRGGLIGGEYLAATAPILGALAGRVVPLELVGSASFGVLPTDPIGLHLAPEREVTVAELANSLLRPFGAYYGDDDLGRLIVGVVAPPGDGIVIGEIEEDEVLDERAPSALFDAPTWQAELSWARNWRPMTREEIAPEHPSLTPERLAALQREERVATDTDSAVKAAYPSALPIRGATAPRTRGYFAEEAGARRAVRNLRRLSAEPMLVRTIEMPLSGRRVLPGTQWLFRGRPAVCIRRKLRLARDLVEVDLVQRARSTTVGAAG